MDPQNRVLTYLTNVVMNNVVPIDPTLEKNDPRLTDYNCSAASAPYSPTNISQFNNYLPTATARDWLYFAANLRGGAKESLNVLSTLRPISGVRYEGFAAVSDGGRFTYWNPGLGPNAFAVVDNPVATVMAMRTDLSLANVIFPTTLPTFNATLVHSIRLLDADEVGRTWTSPIYTDSYGFGDAQVRAVRVCHVCHVRVIRVLCVVCANRLEQVYVYVGGVFGSKCIVNPGESTYVQVRCCCSTRRGLNE